VWCVAGQINQVFMNLLVNAAQAIETKGVITLTTGRRDDRVFISISDSGNGIAPNHLNRLFEPFFTTKPVGKGTGLGLSLAWGIAQRHHGSIEVESEVGKGTTFTLWLPVDSSGISNSTP
jgi:two-component system, NtrC family, sensor kinase